MTVLGSARNWIAVNNSPDGGAYDFLTDSEPDSEQNQAVRWCSGIRQKRLERGADSAARITSGRGGAREALSRLLATHL
jgi:hypothetical protein